MMMSNAKLQIKHLHRHFKIMCRILKKTKKWLIHVIVAYITFMSHKFNSNRHKLNHCSPVCGVNCPVSVTVSTLSLLSL